MKYIRTKDGRIIYWENLTLYDSLDLIKQADTIEELCDEFVFVGENWREWREQFIYLTNAIDSAEEYGYEVSKNCEIYGAIWTKKGLIYVAKMNDKGDLELL